VPKSVRLRSLSNIEAERLTDEADRLYVCENQPLWALERIDRALRIDPRNVGALIVRGRICLSLDRSSDALKCFNRAISIEPKSSSALVERARILYAAKQDHKKALRDVKKAVACAGRERWIKNDAWRLQGYILEALGRDREAMACYRAALRQNPRDAETRTALGDSLLLVGQPAKALLQFNYALAVLGRQKDPDQLDLGFTLSSKADALNALGKYLDALRVTATGLRKVKKGIASEALQSVRKQTLSLLRSAGRQ
jgi:tetratricopeptide (TPR) repeat protein